MAFNRSEPATTTQTSPQPKSLSLSAATNDEFFVDGVFLTVLMIFSEKAPMPCQPRTCVVSAGSANERALSVAHFCTGVQVISHQSTGHVEFYTKKATVRGVTHHDGRRWPLYAHTGGHHDSEISLTL